MTQIHIDNRQRHQAAALINQLEQRLRLTPRPEHPPFI